MEEVLLTATQTMMDVALILALRFHRYTAWALLALFAVQFPITSTAGPADPVRRVRRAGHHGIHRQQPTAYRNIQGALR
ncbi:MAG: hypothetical protein NVSMB60_32570 [Mycobacterium sp.]